MLDYLIKPKEEELVPTERIPVPALTEFALIPVLVLIGFLLMGGRTYAEMNGAINSSLDKAVIASDKVSSLE
jgi:hypothetical protein